MNSFLLDKVKENIDDKAKDRILHLYTTFPVKVGDIALCGHRKTEPGGPSQEELLRCKKCNECLFKKKYL